MCGVVGIASAEPVSYLLYDALLMLQHRGQDAAGIATSDVNGAFCFRKGPGLVREVFNAQDLGNLRGSMGIGHVRYPTSGSTSAAEAQPLYVNAPYGIVLAHNGNLTNATELRAALFGQARRHLNTTSDSEVLLNIFADELSRLSDRTLSAAAIFSAIRGLHKRIRGAYACVALVAGHGMVAFRDPNGIRPLVLGRRQRPTGHDHCDYMIASESAALDAAGFELLRDVAPGEAIHVTSQGTLLAEQTVENPRRHPCLFEFVYFARPDSFIDNISVYSARVNMGRTLGANIARRWQSLAIDVVIPIPETACDIALAIAQLLNLPYRQGFVKNRYVGRTFIMAGQQQRRQSVRRKLNAICAEFRDKAVLLVDDSIVRGTTSRQIVSMAREAGARKVYFASAAPMVQFPNVYGIDTPRMSELVAHGRDPESIRHIIGADALIFQELTDLIAAVREGNKEIQGFETSLFDGTYITGDIDAAYLSRLDQRCQTAGSTQKTEPHTTG